MTTIAKVPFASTIRLLAWLAFVFTVAAAHAAPTAISLPIPGSGQKATQLCWAATAEMAVNALATPVPAMSQERQVALLTLGLLNVPDTTVLTSLQLQQIEDGTQRCTNILGACNRLGVPILEGLLFEHRLAGNPLTKAELIHQIGDLGRPVIFSWDYPDDSGDDSPSGQHFLIAVGYNNANPDGFLEIWDPWPARSDVDTPTSGGNRTFVAYDVYAGTNFDMGLPKAHQDSRTQIRRFPDPPEPVRPNPPTSLEVDGGGPGTGVNASAAANANTDASAASEPASASRARPRSREVSFATAVRNSQTAQQRERALRKPRPWLRESGPLTVGVPFPIVALRVDQIVAARTNPEDLLKRKTSVVLYPVMAGGEVVDSYLMANQDGRWIETGYANTAVTRLLAQARQENAGRERVRPEDFFLISVPEYSAFFASYRSGRDTVAVPVTTDPTIRAVRGVPMPAVDALRQIAEAEDQKSRNTN
jgi:hypothetical protein